MGYDFIIDPPGGSSTGPRRIVPRPAPVGNSLGEQPRPNQFGSFRLEASDAANIIGTAARAPGYIYDRPLAAINTLTSNGEKGIIDQAGDTIRNIPVLGDILSGGAQAVGNTFEGLGRLTAAPLNAGMMNALLSTRGKAETDKVDGITAWLSGAGGAFGDLTVGELRQIAARRGFTEDDVSATATGQRSIFDWADKALSDNPVVDITGRMVADPTNLLAFGAVGRVAQGAQSVADLLRVGGVVAPASSRVARLAQGVTAMNKAVGLSRMTAKGTVAGMAALRAGTVEGVTLNTLGRHLAMVSRGSSDFLRSYRMVAIATTGGQLAAQALDEHGFGDNTPLSPLFEPIYEAAKRMSEDKPLSNGMLFNLWSAVNFPVRSGLREAWSDTRRQGLGVGVGRATLRTPLFKRVTDIEKRFIQELAPGMSIADGRRYLMGPDGFGDEQTFTDVIHHFARSLFAERHVPQQNAWTANPKTTAEFGAQAVINDIFLDHGTRAAIEDGRITGRELMEFIKEKATGARSTAVDPDTGLARDIAGTVDKAWDPKEFIRIQKEWMSKMRELNLATGLQNGTNVVIGVADQMLPKEWVRAAKATLRSVARPDGTVPKDRMDRLLEDYPSLTVDGVDPGNFFARLRHPDSGEVHVEAAIQRLDRLEKEAPTLREYLYEVEAWEARAQRLARKTGTVFDEHGRPDPTRAPEIGGATILSATARTTVRRRMGLGGDKYQDVLERRSEGVVRASEDTLAPALDDSGWNVDAATQGVVSVDGRKTAGVAVHLASREDPGSALLAAAVIARQTRSRSATVMYSGAEALAQHGLTRNASHVRFDIGRMSAEEIDAILDEVTRRFDGQFEMNDTAGVLHVITKEGQVADLEALQDAIIGVVGDARLKVQHAPAWVQVVRNDTRGAARGRATAADVNASDIFSTNELDIRYITSQRAFRTAADERAGLLGDDRPGITRGPEFSRSAGDDLGGDRPGVDEGTVYDANADLNLTVDINDYVGNPPPGLAEAVNDYSDYFVPPDDPGGLSRFGIVDDTRPLGPSYRDVSGAVPPPEGPRPPDLTDEIRAAQDAGGTQGQVLWLAEADDRLAHLMPKINSDLGGLPPEELAKVLPMEAELRRYDPTYRIKAAPGFSKDPSKVRSVPTYYLGQGDSIKDILALSRASSDLMFEKVWRPAADFTNALFGRVYTKRLAQDAKQLLYGEILKKTAHLPDDVRPRVKDIDAFLRTLNAASRNHKMFGSQMYARGDLLPPATIADIADGTYIGRLVGGAPGVGRLVSDAKDIPAFQGFTRETLEALGGAKNIHRFLDLTGSRFYRALFERTRGKGQLGRLIREVYGTGRAVTATPRNHIRSYYHLFRFTLDPRWHMMNRFEADILGYAKYGVMRAGGPENVDNAVRLHAGGRVGGETDLLQDALASGILDARHLEGYIGRAFRKERVGSTRDVIRTMASEDPSIRTLIDRFGGDEDEWVSGLEKMMYEFDNKGVEPTIRDEAQAILDEQDLLAMEPLLLKLYARHKQVFEDVVSTFHGNTNRSNLERIMNSYFLFWPISYQIKATKWLFDVLTERSVGRTTNLGGVVYLDHLYQQHVERLANDENYQRMFVDNPALWQTAAMLLPLTPYDMGVSLSRITRYSLAAGGFIRDEKFEEDPFMAAVGLYAIGPAYSIELARKILRESKDRPRDLVVPVN